MQVSHWPLCLGHGQQPVVLTVTERNVLHIGKVSAGISKHIHLLNKHKKLRIKIEGVEWPMWIYFFCLLYVLLKDFEDAPGEVTQRTWYLHWGTSIISMAGAFPRLRITPCHGNQHRQPHRAPDCLAIFSV